MFFPLVPHLARSKLFQHPLLWAELVAAAILAMSGPFIYCVIFRYFISTFTSGDLSDAGAGFIIAAGSIVTFVTTIFISIRFSRYAT